MVKKCSIIFWIILHLFSGSVSLGCDLHKYFSIDRDCPMHSTPTLCFDETGRPERTRVRYLSFHQKDKALVKSFPSRIGLLMENTLDVFYNDYSFPPSTRAINPWSLVLHCENLVGFPDAKIQEIVGFLLRLWSPGVSHSHHSSQKTSNILSYCCKCFLPVWLLQLMLLVSKSRLWLSGYTCLFTLQCNGLSTSIFWGVQEK